MDKKIFLLILVGVLMFPLVGLAQLVPYADGAPRVSLSGIVWSIELVAGFIFGAIAVLCFLYAGVMFLTAYGEPEKLKLAKMAVLWGFAGVIVGIAAFSIIAIVGNLITGFGY